MKKENASHFWVEAVLATDTHRRNADIKTRGRKRPLSGFEIWKEQS
jgi:hypothetical protein